MKQKIRKYWTDWAGTIRHSSLNEAKRYVRHKYTFKGEGVGDCLYHFTEIDGARELDAIVTICYDNNNRSVAFNVTTKF